MWNYQEILTSLRPSLVVEFGTHAGGSALYFAHLLTLFSDNFRVLTVDIDHSRVADVAKQNPRIEFLTADSTSFVVAKRVMDLRKTYPGNVFFILDSDHSRDHVYAELRQVKNMTIPGDYVIVEDGNINGHPVLPDWGQGPYEALAEYTSHFPNDFLQDKEREEKFGFTFAPEGFLIRR